MTLRLFNTLSRKKEEFKPIHEGEVRFYSCGPTIYDFIHIGNARTFCYWDVLTKYLKYKGFQVTHIVNITDVGHLTDDADQGEDKIEKRAMEKKIDPMELVENYIEAYFKATDDLNMTRPNISPRATGHIIEMIDLIETLIEKGNAYESNGNVYFDISSYSDYNKLANRSIDEIQTQGRIGHDPNKKSQEDFSLWRKASKEHIMKWTSPWGLGYPGWHVECSVMSNKYLGPGTFDIHAGGEDHIFPHHSCEIAQTETGYGHKMANFWLHARFLVLSGGKRMGKSEGNAVYAHEFIEEYGGDTIRMYFSGAHYRSVMEFDTQALENSRSAVNRIYSLLDLLKSAEGGENKTLEAEIIKTRKEFEEAMDDDMNTPVALQAIMRFIRTVNNNIDSPKEILVKAEEMIRELGGILGFKLERASAENKELVGGLIEMLIEQRENYRDNKEWAKSDEIRDKLKSLGVEIKDMKGKTIYSLTN
ncbi:MAG: cysteine--tRNA ligase [Candidatus Kariarchaeaceae archaeon]